MEMFQSAVLRFQDACLAVYENEAKEVHKISHFSTLCYKFENMCGQSDYESTKSWLNNKVLIYKSVFDKFYHRCERKMHGLF